LELTTTRFGTIQYQKSDIIWMVRPFLGFDDLKRFVIVSLVGQEPFKWFQSLEDSSTAFLMIDPLFFKHDYVVEVNPKDVEMLQARKPDDVALFVLVTIPNGKPQRMSANLQAPLAVNLKNNHGAQLVLSDSSYDIAHSIFGEIERKLAETTAGD